MTSVDNLRVSAASGLIGPDLELVEHPTLSIENGQIVGIEQGGRSDLHFPESLLIPGLINAHTHIGDSALKEVGYGRSGWEIVMPPNGVRHVRLRDLSRRNLIESMAATARYMLQHGVVAFGDFREQGVDGATALTEATADLPIEPIIYGRHAVPPLHPDDDFTHNAGLPEGYADEVADVLKVAAGFSVVTANDTTDAGLRETSEVVRGRGGRLAVHAVEDARYREESVRRSGRGDVERIVDCLRPDHIVHMTAANDEELDLVADAGIPIVVCPRMQAVLGNGIPPVLGMLERGIEVALGTDNAMLTSPDPLREMDFLSRGLRALHRDPSCPTPVQVLRMATVNAARALGIDDRIGSISERRDATFASIRLSGDSLVGTSDPVAAVVSRAEASDIAALVIRGMVVAG